MAARPGKVPPELRELMDRFFQTIIEGHVDEVIGFYMPADFTYVLLEGPRWTTRGIDRISTGWRAFFDAGVSLRWAKWVEGPYGQAGDDIGWLSGIVEIRVEAGGAERRMRMRQTYILARDSGDHWKIVHEHSSQPLADPYGIGDWLPKSGLPA